MGWCWVGVGWGGGGVVVGWCWGAGWGAGWVWRGRGVVLGGGGGGGGGGRRWSGKGRKGSYLVCRVVVVVVINLSGAVVFGGAVCASAHTLPVALSKKRVWIGLVANWIRWVNASRLKMDWIYRRRACHAVGRASSRSRLRVVVGQGEGTRNKMEFGPAAVSSAAAQCCAAALLSCRATRAVPSGPTEVADDGDSP